MRCKSNDARTRARANGRDVKLNVHGTGLTLVEWRAFVASATKQGKAVGIGNGLEWNAGLLRAKDPKVRRAQVCETVVGLVLQGTQVMNTDPWIHR